MEGAQRFVSIMTRFLGFDVKLRNVLRKFRWRNLRYTNDIAEYSNSIVKP